jgi:short-subunit dehydrogenase
MAGTTWVRALVTGASGGIGEEFARQLAARGSDLVLVARSADALERLAVELHEGHGVRCEVLPADLTTDEGTDAVAGRVGDVDLLVNNAGFGIAAPVAAVDPAPIDGMIRLNVLALARLTRAALPGMLARDHGAIVNVSSVAGFSPSQGFATYNATKAFVTMFTESLSLEVRGTGVRVQALCPGLTRTGFQAVAGEEALGTADTPDFLWQEPPAVVRASLGGLQRGSVIVTPGVHNKAFVAAASVTPRGVLRRAAGVVMGRRGR